MKTIFEQAGGSYSQVGDYLLPNFSLSEKALYPIGIWGNRHRVYMEQYQKVRFINLLTTGKLNAYLHEVDERAEALFFRTVNGMAHNEGITEELKSENQLLWVQHMYSIRSRAEEIVNTEVIFA